MDTRLGSGGKGVKTTLGSCQHRHRGKRGESQCCRWKWAGENLVLLPRLVEPLTDNMQWGAMNHQTVHLGKDLHLKMAMEKATAPHSSALAWKMPWTEEPGGLQSMGSRGIGHDWATSLSLFTFMHWRRKWQPTPVFLPGKFHGQRSLGGYSPQGH